MKGFVKNIEEIAVANTDFRQVLYTANYSQLVIMALKPGEEIGMEVHKLDQFFRVEEGTGEAVLDGVHTPIAAGFAVQARYGDYDGGPLRRGAARAILLSTRVN